MASRWRLVRYACCALVVSVLAACSDEDEIGIPGSAGEACNPEAWGTDGCDRTSVCVVESNVCRPDCAQEACGSSCSDYFSPIIGDTFSVCFEPTDVIPPGRKAADPRPL
jgi:hypothetical protein